MTTEVKELKRTRRSVDVVSVDARSDRIIRILNWAAAISILVALGMAFFFAPVERTMGNVQRILYFHVGSAWVAMVAFFVALVGGLLYLRRPERRWDALSLASVEIGLVFVTMTIVSGSIWGRPAWNTWWEWTPRLTAVTVMWLVYAAYFMLRGAVEDEERRGRFAAIYVIAGFVTVILAYVSPRLLRDLHPVLFGPMLESARGLTPLEATQGEVESEFAPGLEWKMGVALTVSTLAFSLLYAAWLANRMRLQKLIDETDQLKARVAARLRQG